MRYKFRQHPSRMVTLMATFGGGARAGFNKYPNGMAHCVEHMRFKGSVSYTAKQLLWKLASTGGSWNAWTSEDLVAYHVTIPEDNIETAFECLDEVVNKPIFPEDEMKKEQEVICQEVRMYQDDIGTLVHYKLMESVFDNPLAIPIIGTEGSVNSIVRQNLLDFNQEFYNSEQKLITLCATANYQHFVEKYFGIPDDVLVWKPPYAFNYKPSANYEVVKDGQLQHVINIAFAGKEIDAVAKNRAQFDVFNKIFGSSDVSRLFLTIREDMGLVYGIGSGLQDFMDGNVFTIGTETEPENADKVIKEIDNQINKMMAELPTEEELRSAKNKLRSSEYSQMDTSNRTALRLVAEEFYKHPSTTQYLADIEQVSAQQVKDIAEKVFAGNKYTILGHG